WSTSAVRTYSTVNLAAANTSAQKVAKASHRSSQARRSAITAAGARAPTRSALVTATGPLAPGVTCAESVVVTYAGLSEPSGSGLQCKGLFDAGTRQPCRAPLDCAHWPAGRRVARALERGQPACRATNLCKP